MEKRTEILEIKAPSKWEILKAKSIDIKRYLRGKIIKGTEVFGAPQLPEIRVTKFDDKEYLRKYRIKRKRRNKLAYISRRKNRSGL